MKYIKQSLLLLTIATAGVSFLHAGKLHDLVKKGDVKKVEQFLNDNKGVDVDEEDLNGITPLILECYYGNSEIIKLLLSHGANVNKSDKHNDTPLMTACSYANSEIVELLLSYGADVNKSGADVNKFKKNNLSCLFGYPEIVKILLYHRADVNEYNKDNKSPLKIACLHGHTEIVKILLYHGADVNKPGLDNEIPFNIIKKWSIAKQSMAKRNDLFKQLLSINKKETETNQDVNTRLFIEFNAADHADSFNQNKTLVPFIITDKQRKDLLCAGGFKEVKNKEFIISIGEDLLNNLFFRFEKNNNTLPVFIFEQPKTIHPYVKQLKIQRDFQVFKNRNIKSYDDLIYKIKLLAFAQKSWKKWNKKQKSKVQFEDVTLNFKSDNSLLLPAAKKVDK